LRQLLHQVSAPWESPTRTRQGPSAASILHALWLVPGGAFLLWIMVGDLSPEYFILPSIPPVVLLVGLAVITVLAGRRSLRARWERQRALQRAYTAEISASGIVLEEPMTRYEYQWGAIPGFREKRNVFVLYVSPFAFWMIPKRAFLRREDEDAFKAILV